jgi:hypothetical protein
VKREPTHKCVALKNHLADGRVVLIYGSPRAMRASPTEIFVNGRRITPEEIERGWVDGDENQPRQ